MKFKKIIISTIFILTIFSSFVSAVYADFSDGFKTGFQIGMQIKQKREMKWKAKQLEELEKIFEQWDFFSDTVQKLVESEQMTPDLGKKFLVLNSLLPMDLQEHGQNFYNGIMVVDKDKVAEEKQYFKNIIDTISLSGEQVNSKTFGNLSSLLSSNKKALINIIIESDFSYTTPQSELKYNSFEDKWEYAPPGSTPKYNAFENKWEFAMPNENPKFNAFENKWEYAPSGSVLKYNPFSDSWSYE